MNAVTDNERAKIGGNSGEEPSPEILAEMLADETKALVERAAALAAAAGRCKVADQDTAERATLLAKQIKKHLEDVEEARTTRKAPFFDACKAIDGHFGTIATTLATLDSKKKLTGGPLKTVMDEIDAYRRRIEAEAEAERRRLAEEAAKAAAEAEAAQRAAEEAAKAGDAVEADITAAQKAAQAEALAQQAQSVIARPIDSGLGAKAIGRKGKMVTIVSLSKALDHCLAIDYDGVQAYVQSVYDKQVRAGITSLPGAEITETTSTMIR